MAQFQVVDSTVAVGLLAPMYGSMYSPTGQAIEGEFNAYKGVTTFSEEVAVGVTTDTSDAAGDHFTIPAGGAGDYLIIATASGNPRVASNTWQFAIVIDKVADTNFLFTLDGQADDDQSSGMTVAIKTLADGAEVALYGINLSQSAIFDLNGAQLSIVRLAA